VKDVGGDANLCQVRLADLHVRVDLREDHKRKQVHLESGDAGLLGVAAAARAGKFIHNGEMLEYWLSDSERETLRVEAYRSLGLSPDYGETAPMDDDVALFADIQGDWAQLKAVVEHWDETVARELETIVAD